MATCKYCETGGILQATDRNGLCKRCAFPVLSDIQQRARIMEDSIRLAQDGKTLATRLSRHELLMDQLGYLREYEDKGITTLSPAPSELVTRMKGYRDTIITEEIVKIADRAKKKAELTASPSSKFNVLAKALLTAQDILEVEGKTLGDDSSAIELRLLMHRSKIEGYITEARKAEFKGNAKKAIDQYQEALFYIHNDDIDDDVQRELINNIESRLSALTGEAKPALAKPV